MDFEKFTSQDKKLYIGRWKFISVFPEHKSFEAEFIVDEFIRIGGFAPYHRDFIEFKGTILKPVDRITEWNTIRDSYIIPLSGYLEYIKFIEE